MSESSSIYIDTSSIPLYLFGAYVDVEYDIIYKSDSYYKVYTYMINQYNLDRLRRWFEANNVSSLTPRNCSHD